MDFSKAAPETAVGGCVFVVGDMYSGVRRCDATEVLIPARNHRDDRIMLCGEHYQIWCVGNMQVGMNAIRGGDYQDNWQRWWFRRYAFRTASYTDVVTIGDIWKAWDRRGESEMMTLIDMSCRRIERNARLALGLGRAVNITGKGGYNRGWRRLLFDKRHAEHIRNGDGYRLGQRYRLSPY